MRFLYKEWETFCRELDKKNIHSITAEKVFEGNNDVYLVLKHDVETKPQKALRMAQIEARYSHYGTYYFQAYLLNKKNEKIIKSISDLGHEVSYHYDVLDACKGNIDKAIIEFERNKNIFEKYGYPIKTVCQHGNPIVKRTGYTSNRDFFRNEKVQQKYSGMADIMVNFKQKASTEYDYISDAGMGFKWIFDPINNDVTPSDNKNVAIGNLDNIIKFMEENKRSVFISIHPHRWTKNAFGAAMKNFCFKTIRYVAKILCRIPFMKKLMEKYYYLAKKL